MDAPVQPKIDDRADCPHHKRTNCAYAKKATGVFIYALYVL